MRLFIGIDFPDYVTRHLSQLRGSLTYVRWYDPRTYLLTLNFIGEINDYDLLNDLDLTLEKISPPSFNLTIDKVNLFQTASNTQILWAGIQPSESLVHLRKKVEQILRQLEIKTQKQKFVPHITLGKGSYKMVRFIQFQTRQSKIVINGQVFFSRTPKTNRPIFL